MPPPTGKNITNKSAQQRASDKVSTGIDETGAVIFTAFDDVATATTVGAAGGAAALPATPLGYIHGIVNGVLVKIPYYNQ